MPCSIGGMHDLGEGPIAVGRSNSALNGITEKGWTATLSSTVVPEPVMRWPKPVQSSITVNAGRVLRHEGEALSPSSSLATTAIQWAKSTPVE